MARNVLQPRRECRPGRMRKVTCRAVQRSKDGRTV
jgi:hypothetical protein